VGKWLARLAVRSAETPCTGTDETDKRGVLSVLAVTDEEVCEVLQPRPEAANTATPAQARACGDCRHLLRRGTCADPVAAGLADSFSICWPAEGYGDNCAAFSGKVPGKAIERPYRLTKADADRCHAPEWQDVDIARFSARVQRFARLGIDAQDGDDLAERLTLRDRDDDKRVMCAECRHYRPGRCGNHKAAGLHAAEMGRDMAELLQWCAGFETTR
jgi:hypothetical protein